MNKLIAGTALTGMIFSGAAAFAASVTNQATVTILAPLELSAENDMDFGKIIKPSSQATVVVSESGALSGSIGGGQLASGGNPGTVGIVGDANSTVTISITDAGGATGLSLGSFTASFPDNNTVNLGTSGTVIPGGNSTLKIGATLTVEPGVEAGIKYPTYNVDVVYN